MKRHICLLFFVFCLLFTFYGVDDSTSNELNEKFVSHKVKKGDTLQRIAQMYGDEVKKICQRNDLKKISRGQILAVSPKPQMVLASWYGRPFHGRKMANGKIFNMNDPTVVAHKYLPLGTTIVVCNPVNKKMMYLKVQDRGPYIKGRELDLSREVARRLGTEKAGVASLIYSVVPN